MADFFTDLFDAVTGQQAVPQQTIIPTSDLLSQTYGTMAGTVAPGVLAYNRALAPGLTDIQLGVERQYDPNIATLRGATTKSILDELNLGGGLGQELQEQVVRNALEGATASGFGSPVGLSAGGRGLVARDLGITSLDLARARRGEALQAVRSSPALSSLYQPGGEISPGEVAGSIQGVQAAQDEFANLKEDIRRKNFSSLISTGFKIIGGVVGGIYGGPAGAKMGSDAGGAVIQGSGVGGRSRAAQGGGSGGNQFSSILSGIGGMGGGGGGGGYGEAAFAAQGMA